MRETRTRQLNDILNTAVHYLSKKHIEHPRLNAELLLCHVLQCNRVDLYVNLDTSIEASAVDRFVRLLKRRASHEPLQYLIHESEFMFVRLKVNDSVLIPRPETEILVEYVIKHVKQQGLTNKTINILDIGTGSGNIAISLAKALPNARLTAIDISAKALEVARENAARNDCLDSINFELGDILSDDYSAFVSHRFDIIVSNPPYINESDYRRLPEEIRLHEPEIALLAADNGLIYYRAIAAASRHLLLENGLLACEIGADQREDLMHIFASARLTNIQCHQDLAGRDRIITAIR
ncbi:peptide chain release factor N(5)-glutamine methyltransferase [candidate division KSB1 bacterium]|nr:peptide chain release factor N(5)-glutamine methyltransferase [candidate division KSB1 bacterium]